jgi:penicillin-binding protein 1A
VLNARIEADGDAATASQSSAILIKPDGAITTLIGGLDYNASKFNRVTQALRQPGSSFKPFVFAAALQAGLDPFSVYQDAPVKFGEWEPENYSPGFFGPVTMSEAFAKSLNTVAALIGNEIGEPSIIAIAKSFGINSDLRPLPSIALGSQEVTLYELTRAYGVFAKSGERLDPYLILQIEDSRGQVIFERPQYDPVRVFPAELAEDMNAMLARVVQNGTGKNAAIPGWTVAGKTGTSQDWRDGWFIGFTSEMIGGVWVGNDDDSPMNKVTGGGLPARLWAEIMTAALADTEITPLAGAEGIIIPSPRAEERITFYRSLSGAFGAVEQRTLANASGSPDEFQR